MYIKQTCFRLVRLYTCQIFHTVSLPCVVTQIQSETGRRRCASSTEHWSGFSSGVRLKTLRSSEDLWNREHRHGNRFEVINTATFKGVMCRFLTPINHYYNNYERCLNWKKKVPVLQNSTARTCSINA